MNGDWFDSGTIWTLTIVSIVTLAWFIYKTMRDKYPLVDIRVFRFQLLAGLSFSFTTIGSSQQPGILLRFG